MFDKFYNFMNMLADLLINAFMGAFYIDTGITLCSINVRFGGIVMFILAILPISRFIKIVRLRYEH